jgi:hypothetical protein
MDLLQFFASVISSLAWPVAMVVLGFVFKEQFKALLQKVRHAKGVGIELDFAEDVKRIVMEAEQVKQEEISIDGGPAVDTGVVDDKDKLYEILRERPSALILDAWRDVEKSVQDVMTAIGIEATTVQRKNVPPTLWAGLLQRNGVLSHEEATLIADLRTLRNKVAHALDWEPTASDALDYHRTASLIVDVLRKKLIEAKLLKQ